MRNFFFALFMLFSSNVIAEQIGVIKQIKGDVLLYKRLMEINDPIESGDVITTGATSFAKIELKDQTIVTLGPSSEFDFAQYKNSQGERDSLYNIIRGQVRIHVQKKTGPKEKINFKSGIVALGVRGTEFLVNAYQAANKATADVALVSGELAVEGQGIKPFRLQAGEYFNSNELIANGTSAVQKLNPEMLKKIKQDFMPNLQSATGALLGFGALVAAATSVIPDSKDQKEEKPTPIVEEKKKEAASLQTRHGEGFAYDLAKEPWDIRDNVMNFEENKKQNDCFYFFYKKLPGAGEEERFRRSRSCDDFDFDL
ncbi:MAG: hypothetical protein COW00_13050 [Bdellovibrio sp. CG12_big_fil_rev_8_21_14_0_65_39_13]|nr:MAG: hypothetical protein COW78_05370 [Bdellovibrio sp. CG22_combo_CG10-13_8_21_14_all_39_27]PIQ59007.1 MAG: hypothetical protein COW00_13050 [Bdellovibrio sp. CG12_big_fil_rev_8_21_14_0_65_39_13]PIR33437.1 MAG: hypothetical protein COV37_16320 [Bdellovibrio sp. CG11_big_fil_rev_8_21_14_0_20_39_38]